MTARRLVRFLLVGARGFNDMQLERSQCIDFARTRALEWLEADGRGGYAAGTVCGALARREHGLLVAAMEPPNERVLLVQQVEDEIETAGETFPLATRVTRNGVALQGFKRLVRFDTEPWPTWTYEAGGAVLERSVCMRRGVQAVIVRWHLREHRHGSVRLRARPMITRRSHAAVCREPPPIETIHTSPRDLRFRFDDALPALRAHFTGSYVAAPVRIDEIEYALDRARGEPDVEDWFSPGVFEFDLCAGDVATLVFCADPNVAIEPERWLDEERARRAIRDAPSGDALYDSLRTAADAFIAEGTEGMSILAGYPWFGVWSRDTFTSLHGLCLATGRHREARRILETFAAHVRDGRLPNNIRGPGHAERWNTIDAPLWFIVAADRYLRATGDERTARDVLFPTLRAIVNGYRRGDEPYGIRVADDGLVTGGDPRVPLTWMDAQYEGTVFTPRRGKPVEVQALWVHALEILARWSDAHGDRGAAIHAREDLARARDTFAARFWYAAGGYLFDVIDGPDGDDARLRPNQIFALSLPEEPLVPHARAAHILDIVRARLLTPFGLRTLSPDDPNYRPHYEGARAERDPAYHNGTVWPFLLGPWVAAWVRVHGRSAHVRRQARAFLDAIEQHIVAQGCLGQASEIFDAEPPHRPRGCFAQAWSAGEILTALVENVFDPR